MSDMSLLHDLEKEIGKKLNRVELKNIGGNQNGYSVDEKGRISGLNLDKCKLTSCPRSISKMNHLLRLSLFKNKFSKSFTEILQLQNLQTLDVSSNQLSFLPPEIAQLQLQNLQTLDLRRNQLSFLPPEIAQLKNLQTLDLYSNQLSFLPPEIAQLQNLQTLDLRRNQLRSLPPEIAQLKNMQTLYLHRNQLRSLPPEIAQLQNLQTLDVSSNQLSSLPPGIAQLKKLQTLSLYSNQLSFLPPGIVQLQNLQTLDLSSNQLSSLPSGIAQLQNLQTLDLSSNQLSSLPPGITQLHNLRKLDLRWNKLTTLPPEISKIRIEILWKPKQRYGFKGIALEANPLESPPVEIAKRGREAVRNYFESIADAEETMHLFEAKLLVVGEGGVGKTTLVNALTKDGFEFDLNEGLTTGGIDIRQWEFHFSDDDGKPRQFVANIWDFGGQEIYHATHQFFLSHRSLYVLVWEAKQDYHDQGFYYWLNVVRLLSAGSPVIVVMNKKDIREKVVDEATLLERFPNIVGFHKVSCANGKGIGELRESIREALRKLPHVGAVWSKKWTAIREKLETNDRDYINFKEYLDICAEFDMNAEEANHLGRYFHDLAGILNFQDNPLLKNFVILKPEWATHAVYNVLDTRSIRQNKARFNFTELEDIWKEKLYPTSKHPHLLELMKKFELVLQFEDAMEYLVPELLPGDRPPFPWDEANNLRFEYRYEFMPKGIITRLTVRLHTLIENDYYWKNGVVLAKGGTRTRIVSDYYNQKISISIHGSYAREMLAIIRNHLEYIHETLNNPPLREMIPCNCHKCMNIAIPFYHDFASLQKRREKRKYKAECAQSFEDVPIEGLLAGIYRKRAVADNQWDVFISYSSKDFAIIQEIINDLKSLGVTYWWDEEQLKPGVTISKKIEEGLNNCRFVMPCLSYNQLNSDWARAEYSAILHEIFNGKDEQQVTPLIIDDMREEDVPPLLKDIKCERRLDKERYWKLLSLFAGVDET